MPGWNEDNGEGRDRRRADRRRRRRRLGRHRTHEARHVRRAGPDARARGRRRALARSRSPTRPTARSARRGTTPSWSSTRCPGDAHAAGRHSANDKRPGWWDMLIGPGKALDTERYFVISANVIGGCSGSTGPSSTDPATGRPYGTNFPMITIADMVEAHLLLLDHLGIDKLLAAVGGSMGGMQVLRAGRRRIPDRLHLAVAMATAARQPTQAIAFNEVGRQAIMADPDWRGGALLRRQAAGQRPRRGAHGRPHHLPLRRGDAGEVRPPAAGHPRRTRSRSTPTSRSRATCATRGSRSRTASTPTPTCTSRGRSTTSTWPRRHGTWSRPSASRARASSSWPSRATGCTRRTSSRRSSAPCARRTGTSATTRSTSHYGHDAFLLEREKMEGVIAAFLASGARSYAPR